ncbi:efflux transporter outer membrane subunit [Sphingomonas morindae]|uniref:Efflux transporter outer membrane subunit n=1 Tax=Sphingomonas morindae TaxID=1541170 RepID=A0ABY4XBT5_9SPHN|nr:efflux transporter outer membrane subunit [Sphingomonas morindae]USI74377.1 efflux transporter outer membrane subunit [Sphingomonas morindae]
MSRRLAPLAALLALAGCTVGPNYRAPEPALPQAFAAQPGPVAASPVDLTRWWEAFRDPQLTQLIAIGMAEAPDLQTAASRVRQARFQLVQARAAGLPQINGSVGGQYLRFDRIGQSGDVEGLVNRLRGQTQGAGGAGDGGGAASAVDVSSLPNDIKLVSAGFDASWAVDLFGGVRRQTEAARDQVQAAEWDARDARILLAGEIASDYLQMRGFQQQAAIAGEEADRQARALGLLEHTAQVGLVPQGNATRQRTQLATARAQVAPLQAQAQAQIHAIAVLIGRTPESLTGVLSPVRALPDAPPAIPPGLPVDLIRRRPDVRAAERRLAAATAQIGVQVAQLYPQISLTAMPQLAATWLGGFFIGKALQLTAQGAASFPILDFGRRRAGVDIAREQREQAYVQWRQTVLQALRDVEDALVRYDAERQSNDELRGGVASAQRALGTVTAQYQVGLSDYQPVLDAQQQLLQIRNSLTQSDTRIRTDLASLYLALGGGWREDDPAPIRPTIEDQPRK